MPILAYCVSMSYDFLDAPTEAVGGTMVYETEELGLRAWYSEVEEETFAGAENVTKAALEFHRFVSAVFREGNTLPFRFPTILETVDELRSHLEEKSVWYAGALRRSERLAQFEARVITKAKLTPEAASGTEYLEARKRLRELTNEVVNGLLAAVEDYVREHHVKETQQGPRVYLMVERSRIGEFRAAAGQAKIPDGFEVRLTGPWPPTEFLPAPGDEA
jgi:Gas vesicle synthesis protein GvpL/GvpF